MTDLVADERVFKFYTDVEQDLRASVRAAVEEKCPLAEVARRFDKPDPEADHELWEVLGGQLGTAGLLIPEEFDGAGATAREAGVVLEEIGRGVTPVPYLSSAVWATTLLCTLADSEPGSDLAATLSAMAANTATACVVTRIDTVPGAAFPSQLTATVTDGTTHLNGSASSVIGARNADVLIVPALLDGESVLILVHSAPATADGSTTASVRRAPVVSLDESNPLSDVVFDDCPGTVIASGAEAEAAFGHALVVAAALLASEQLGVAERCLEETVAYAKTRHQFGRTIGSFQVVKHRLADLWAQVEGARTAARYAATCAAIGSDDLPVASALAAAYCAEAAVKAAEECVQLHGGIGFTWEHPAHLWLKRAMAQSVMFGGADALRARLAELVDLSPS
jgi:alkylation response protein AidB-like acyl-CoA dehydrogenase